MGKVSESNTNNCLAAKELKDAGIRDRTGAFGADNFPIKLSLMRGTASKISCIDLKTFAEMSRTNISEVLSITK